ncbi:MAG TPA: hypothetical protein VMU28_10280 [Terriglobales bacterium]|nr:hypothetical protein [Terriglobales bacterium]
MSPGVRSGSIVNVIAVEIGAIRVGMLVAFLREGRIFVHRVVSMDSHEGVVRLVTRGDALTADDPSITSQEFLGVVTAMIPPGRRTFTERGFARVRWTYRNLLRSLHA